MSKTSIADAIVAWESALANARTSATEVPGIEGYTAPLEQILADAKALTARLDDRKAVKQQETLERKILMKKGNVQVSRIRSAVKAFFGPNSERVIAFGARPVRPRTRKTPTEPAAPPQVPPAPAPEVAEGSRPGAGTAPGKENEAPRNPTAL
jgi:hypothetical protein